MPWGRDPGQTGLRRRRHALARRAHPRSPSVRSASGPALAWRGPHRPRARRPAAADEGRASAAERAPGSSATHATRAPPSRRAPRSLPERGGEDVRRGVSAGSGPAPRPRGNGRTLPTTPVKTSAHRCPLRCADLAQQPRAQRRQPLGAVHAHALPPPGPLGRDRNRFLGEVGAEAGRSRVSAPPLLRAPEATPSSGLPFPPHPNSLLHIRTVPGGGNEGGKSPCALTDTVTLTKALVPARVSWGSCSGAHFW